MLCVLRKRKDRFKISFTSLQLHSMKYTKQNKKTSNVNVPFTYFSLRLPDGIIFFVDCERMVSDWTVYDPHFFYVSLFLKFRFLNQKKIHLKQNTSQESKKKKKNNSSHHGFKSRICWCWIEHTGENQVGDSHGQDSDRGEAQRDQFLGQNLRNRG